MTAKFTCTIDTGDCPERSSKELWDRYPGSHDDSGSVPRGHNVPPDGGIHKVNKYINEGLCENDPQLGISSVPRGHNVPLEGGADEGLFEYVPLL